MQRRPELKPAGWRQWHAETNVSIGLRLLRLSSSQENFAARAESKNLTVRAIRLARVTAAAAMPDEPMTPVCPMLARHELHQIQLDLHRVLVLRQAKPLRQADHVCVHHDAFVFVKGIAQYYVRRLAS